MITSSTIPTSVAISHVLRHRRGKLSVGTATPWPSSLFLPLPLTKQCRILCASGQKPGDTTRPLRPDTPQQLLGRGCCLRGAVYEGTALLQPKSPRPWAEIHGHPTHLKHHAYFFNVSVASRRVVLRCSACQFKKNTRSTFKLHRNKGQRPRTVPALSRPLRPMENEKQTLRPLTSVQVATQSHTRSHTVASHTGITQLSSQALRDRAHGLITSTQLLNIIWRLDRLSHHATND